MTTKKTETESTTTKTEKKDEYVVVIPFYDAEDKRKEYLINDPYPKPASKKATQKRIDQLLKHENGKSYIRKK
ncbi:hypothetical protein KYI07_07585 [Macrococcus psychrotolerans]|uniref:Uncharacterized protein n=1 Tax=Macrococcus psychrotolerans TaxID=3039389 RepID=A0AAT9P5P2_9STAP|nr:MULTISPECIES: hypothetical protein [Macrococcus]QYA32249.1 hypothetical protein KYI10_07595 [Macrococcus sp. 19Msa1099]QYA37055.1 hypothetical protein KYI07_07585 [Macrococcus caseolyticus]QYA75763.1 hypothetical protein KYI12_07585 [Macrococcus caseolyticus]